MGVFPPVGITQSARSFAGDVLLHFGYWVAFGALVVVIGIG
jgi:hypothetical protein